MKKEREEFLVLRILIVNPWRSSAGRKFKEWRHFQKVTKAVLLRKNRSHEWKPMNRYDIDFLGEVLFLNGGFHIGERYCNHGQKGVVWGVASAAIGLAKE